MTALREVLAELDLRIRGLDQIHKANREVDALRSNLTKRLTTPGGDDMFSHAMRHAVIRTRAAREEFEKQQAGVGRPATSLNNSLLNVAAGFTAVNQAIGIARQAFASLVAPVVDALASVIQLGDALEAQAQSTGISTGELQKWQFIAERGNVDANTLVASMSRLQRTAFASPRAFRALGVSVRGANGDVKSASDLFRDTGLALSRIEDPAERAARAQQLFGRQGRALLPIFAEGEAGLEAMIARFHELGGGLSDDVIKASAGADDALVDLRLALTGLKGVLAATVLPTLTKLITGLADIAAKLAELVKTSSLVQSVLVALAGVALVVGAAMLAFGWPVLLAGAALAALVLIVDDVITAFRGGDSVFGSFVERLMEGMGVTVTFIGLLERFGIAWEGVKIQAFQAVAAILGGIDDLQRTLGVELFSGAAGTAGLMRDRALGATDERDQLITDHERNERQRRLGRAMAAKERLTALESPTTVIESPSKRGRRGRSQFGRSSGRGAQTNHFNIQTHDPAGVRREVQAVLQEQLRDVEDGIPELEPEPA